MFIDAYAHISVPRFLKAEEFLRVMDEHRVEKAVLATAETCPDLAELSRAAIGWPDRFRVVGMPLGNTPQEALDAVSAQLDAGFVGIRLPDTLVTAQPKILERIGAAGGAAFIVGCHILDEAARVLVDFLEGCPQSVVVATHFAGMPPGEALSKNRAAILLLSHERFLVTFSRQGAYDAEAIKTWARWLVGKMGWERLMYGSEYPVCLWRDETYASTVRWIETAGLSPTARERSAFFHENAQRFLFERKLSQKPLDEKWHAMHLRKPAPVWLFPRAGVDLPEEVHRKLLLAYLAQGGDRSGSYRDFVTKVLAEAAGGMPSA